MKLLAEITDASLGLGDAEQLGSPYELRKSARAIVLNEAGEMAVQYLQNYTYHKLPGGGVEAGESLRDAAVREVREEVGCVCDLSHEVGVVIEYRNKYNLLHLSYCFVGALQGVVGVPELEEGEIEEGQVTLWMKPEDARAQMRTDVPLKYEGHFILKREISFLEEFLRGK